MTTQELIQVLAICDGDLDKFKAAVEAIKKEEKCS